MHNLTSHRLTADQIDQILAKKLNWMLTYSQPQKIYLVGSGASRTMSTSSDVDLILIFLSEAELKLSQKNLAKNRPKDDWPHDLIFHTEASFESSVLKGGGVCWLAKREGKVLFDRGANES